MARTLRGLGELKDSATRLVRKAAKAAACTMNSLSGMIQEEGKRDRSEGNAQTAPARLDAIWVAFLCALREMKLVHGFGVPGFWGSLQRPTIILESCLAGLDGQTAFRLAELDQF